MKSAFSRLLFGQRLYHGRWLASSRGMVPSEFIFGVIAVLAGLAGCAGDGSLNRLLAEGGHIVSWGVMYCGGGALAAALAVLAYCEDDLCEQEVMRLSYTRMVASGLMACCWAYIFRLMAIENMVQQAISICGVAIFATPFCVRSLFFNALAARALDRNRFTPQLVPDRRRH